MAKVKSISPEKGVHMKKKLTMNVRLAKSFNPALEVEKEIKMHGCCGSEQGKVKVHMKIDNNLVETSSKFKIHYTIDNSDCEQDLENITLEGLYHG